MKHLIKNKYWNLNEDYNKEKLLYLLIDRPDKINIYDHFSWHNDKNKIHRNYDLPAIGYYNYILWYKNNKIHREDDKPAYIRSNGYKEYWSNHKQVK